MTVRSTLTGKVTPNHRFDEYCTNGINLILGTVFSIVHLLFPPFGASALESFSLFNTVYHGILLYLLVRTTRIYIYIDSLMPNIFTVVASTCNRFMMGARHDRGTDTGDTCL